VDNFLALIGFNVLNSTFGTHVIAATAPYVHPFAAILRTTIVIDELFLGHFFLHEKDASPSFRAIESP
jgi:hypothetical protein